MFFTTAILCFNACTKKQDSPTGIIISDTTAPSIQWAKCFGGENYDYADMIQQTSDNGYIIGGMTRSLGGDITGKHANSDFWIVKLDENGKLLWQKTLGGSGDDYCNSIQQTSDGRYIVGGETESNDGDVTSNNGGYDFWVVKLNAVGKIVWQKTFGGSQYDNANSIQQTSDGGYIVAGETESFNGDVVGNHGSSDYWIVKLDANGSMMWQKTLGGRGFDAANSIKQTFDGGYIVTGFTLSSGGDVTNYRGGNDFWVVRLDAKGNIVWQKTLGGSFEDDAYSISQTSDGGYIVAGRTLSNNGDVIGNHGDYDSWVVKLDGNGTLIWQKTLGGTEEEEASSVQQTLDGGYIVAGFTKSINGDVTSNRGEKDAWIVKLDMNGNIVWQTVHGGSENDDISSVQQTADGKYIVAGYSNSTGGDVIGNHGLSDFWIVKFK